MPRDELNPTWIKNSSNILDVERTPLVLKISSCYLLGWFEGERIRDGVCGWFPANHTEEIRNEHVRARNLHQRYRLLAASTAFLDTKKRWHQLFILGTRRSVKLSANSRGINLPGPVAVLRARRAWDCERILFHATYICCYIWFKMTYLKTERQVLSTCRFVRSCL